MSLFACATVNTPPAKSSLPAVVGSQTTGGSSVPVSGGVLPVALPANINPGEKLIILISAVQSTGGAITIGTPSGWAGPKVGLTTLAIITRVADGTEGSTVNVPASGGSGSWDFSAIAIRVKGADPATAPAVGSATSTSTKLPDPPSLTSGFGAVPTLWMAVQWNVGTASANQVTGRSYPSGYTGGVAVDTAKPPNAYGYIGMSVAFKNTSLATEDPGTFSLTVTTAPPAVGAYTVAVKGVP